MKYLQSILLLSLFAMPAFASEYEFISYAPALQAETELAPVAAGLTENGDVVVEVRNDSLAKVVAVRLGWTLTDCGSDRKRYVECALKAPFLHGTTGLFTTGIEPGKTAEIKLKKFENLVVSQLAERGSKAINIYNVDFGVVYVRFADGADWTYDLENKRRWKLDFNIGIPKTKLEPVQCTGDNCGYRALGTGCQVYIPQYKCCGGVRPWGSAVPDQVVHEFVLHRICEGAVRPENIASFADSCS